MNKYSSKAVKTAATVGMSLAMVLSNAAPVMAANVTTDMCGTDIEDKTCGRTVLNAVLEKLDGTPFAESNMDNGLEVKDAAGNKISIYEAIAKNVASLTAFKNTLSYSSDEYKTITAMVKFHDAMVVLFGSDYATTEVSDTEFGAGIIKTVLEDKDGSALTKANLTKVKDAKKDAGEVIGSDFLTLVNQAQYKLEDALNIDEEDFDEKLANFYDAFNKVLENDLDGKATKLTAAEQAITGYSEDVTKVNLSSKSAVKARINKIKDADDYDQFKDEDLVISLIDAYQEIIDSIGNISDITTTDSYKAYNKTKTDDEDKTVKSFISALAKGKVNVDGDFVKDGSTTATEEAKAVAKVLDSEQWAILKDLKEEVLDSVWKFETTKIGNYYRDKSEFNSYVSGTQKNVVMNNIPGFLLKVVNTETGEFGYDYLEAHMEKVADALDAVTKDIEKLTPANIKASDKATLEAAEDAIYELTEGGKYVKNLTSKQAKEVRKAETKITNLREAFDNLGTTNVAGWYDMGNGNWGYNNEDGTPAAYKWVASGADWYMIKDGKMLRNTWLATDGGRWYYLDNAGKMVTNQSVDGCWINSYGVYMSPSYNG
ncbi:hypothetical protein [Dielma fastidiosa]|uniref:Cell wall binding repeat protein n=1 Tax=Dielma fastidiosa TaxID=1034346 RepID=A0AB35UMB1_9FIRM|nr:hypothetical protein [Dielma fastidiosa]MDY5168076.1 hypothetical protein [Dielma fastidiosa]